MLVLLLPLSIMVEAIHGVGIVSHEVRLILVVQRNCIVEIVSLKEEMGKLVMMVLMEIMRMVVAIFVLLPIILLVEVLMVLAYMIQKEMEQNLLHLHNFCVLRVLFLILSMMAELIPGVGIVSD